MQVEAWLQDAIVPNEKKRAAAFMERSSFEHHSAISAKLIHSRLCR
jgi:hypothetical protein